MSISKTLFPAALSVLCVLAGFTAAAAPDMDSYSDRIHELERYTYAGTANIGAGFEQEARKCLPNWDERYAASVKNQATLMADASQKARDAADDEYGFLALNRPFIGVLRSGQKSTKYMCDRGYESLLGEYDFRVKHYEDALQVLDAQSLRLAQALAENEKLFDKKQLQKDFSAGHCIFNAGVTNGAKGLNGSIDNEKKAIDGVAEYYRMRLVEERQDRKDAVEEKAETCDGKRVKAGVKQNPGYANEVQEDTTTGHAPAN